MRNEAKELFAKYGKPEVARYRNAPCIIGDNYVADFYGELLADWRREFSMGMTLKTAVRVLTVIDAGYTPRDYATWKEAHAAWKSVKLAGGVQ